MKDKRGHELRISSTGVIRMIDMDGNVAWAGTDTRDMANKLFSHLRSSSRASIAKQFAKMRSDALASR